MPDLLLPFLGVVAVLTVTPGPDMLLVLRNGLRAGPPVAWVTGLGCCLGISLHAGAAVLGLSAVLAASATAYTAVKLAGAAYLGYLGVRLLLAALRPPAEPAPRRPVTGSLETPATGRGEAFRQGLLTNLLNPKIALLFLTLLPQFVGPQEPRLRTTATLAAVFLALAVLWWRLFTLALAPISRALRGPRTRRALDGAAGAALLAVGLRVALRQH
ncbi:LysE family translocator [Actinomadura craniellae]|uniref:LysE family translocator n=1 Tax=Actinomadura craniellae TaxID=2231787 RepID=A0A365GWE9_9ACTN|nr:LysE family translocator [Actinomadura craniellae]RAY11136.1 LysE family translocator [Actinomadura craniellae]